MSIRLLKLNTRYEQIKLAHYKTVPGVLTLLLLLAKESCGYKRTNV